MLNKHETELNQFSGKTIALLQFSDGPVLIRELISGQIQFEQIDLLRQSNMYKQETRDLLPSSKIQLNKYKKESINLVQIGITPPKVHWIEKTRGNDEPIITFAAKDGLLSSTKEFSMNEQELFDLFIPEYSKKKSASFFTMETTTQEMIGMVFNRERPTILFLTPSIDNPSFNPKMGLQNVLESIYRRLSEHMTPFQFDVDEKVRAAMSTSYINFQYDTSSMSQQRQRDIHKHIFLIKTYLLAQRAENNGKKAADPDILKHFPLLKVNGDKHKTQDLMRTFFGIHGLEAKQIRIDNSIWENLTVSTQNLFGQIGSNIPQESFSRTPQLANPIPLSSEVYARTDQLFNEQETLDTAEELVSSIHNALHLFEQTEIVKINNQSVEHLNQYLDICLKKTQKYVDKQKKKLASLPVATLSVQPNTIQIGELNDTAVLEFLTGNATENNKKIVDAFNAWNTYVLPIYRYIHEEKERKISSLMRLNSLREADSELTDSIVRNMQELLWLGPGMKDVNVASLMHIILANQILYSLEATYMEIKESDDFEEKEEWILSAINTVQKLRQLPINPSL